MNKKNQFVIMLIMVMVFSYAVYVFATPPASPYAPGITLDPACAPGDPNCTIHPPLTTTLTSTTTITMDNYPLNFDSGTLYIDSLNNRIGIGTTSPSQQLEITKSLSLPTTTDSTTGIIYKGSVPFMHNFIPTGADGRNTFVGINAGNFTMDTEGQSYKASNNTAIGEKAFSLNTSGYQNTAVGTYALNANTSGLYNTAVGAFSLQFNTVNSRNSGFGRYSLYSLSTGYDNTGIGNQAGACLATGYYNVFVGSGAGQGYTGSSCDSVFDGSVFVGYHAGFSFLTGTNNILIGYQAGDNMTNGSNNIIIGNDINAASSTGSNQLSIGNVIYGDLGLGNIGIGTSSPYAKLSVVGETVSSYFTATSTTATSTFANGLDISGGCFAINGTCVGGGGGGMEIGGTVTSGTPGSVLFVDSSGLAQDNSNFYWDWMSRKLLIGATDGGSVGIGGSQPDFNLLVSSSLAPTIAITNTAFIDTDTPFTSGELLFYGGVGTNIGVDSMNLASIRGINRGGGGGDYGALLFFANNSPTPSERMRIVGNGNVGIGTEEPEFKLEVAAGAICVDSGIDVNCNFGSIAGDIYYGSAHASWTDIAESYPSNEQLEPGDIISLDTISIINGDQKKPYIKKAKQGETLLGAISTKPGLILGDDYGKSEDPLVALSGRIPVKVNLEGGEIKPGDRISLSSKPGVGKKSSNFENSIGIALEGYNKQEEGKILVFINLFYKDISLMQNTLQKTANSFQWILDQFRNMGMFINNGILQVKEIVADKITAKEICIEDICVDKSQLEELLEKR